jgi:hypothetical protein
MNQSPEPQNLLRESTLRTCDDFSFETKNEHTKSASVHYSKALQDFSHEPNCQLIIGKSESMSTPPSLFSMLHTVQIHTVLLTVCTFMLPLTSN